MAQSYWLVNSNRSEVRRFIKNRDNKDQFFQYMFVDYGKIVGVFGKEAPVMQRRTELKIDGINNFEWYPTRYDQTHNLKLTSNFDLNRNCSSIK